jgi:hypothetical protein
MNFVTAWKASSILLAGIFGIVGLLTDFRDRETRKITRWGYISLSGILLSSLGGGIVQIVESQSDAAKSLELARQSATIMKNLERILSPINGLSVELVSHDSCSGKENRHICDAIRSLNEPVTGKDWSKVFGSLNGSQLEFHIYVVNSLEDAVNETDWVITFGRGDDRYDVKFDQIAMYEAGNDSFSTNFNIKAIVGMNDGSVHSLRDLDGKFAVVKAYIAMLPITVDWMSISNDSGEKTFCVFDEKARVAETPIARICQFKRRPN